mgnify:CR=1 FL=1
MNANEVASAENVKRCFKQLNSLRQKPKSMNTVRPIYALHGDIGKEVEVKNGSEGSLTEKSEHKNMEGGEGGLTDDEDVTDEGAEVKVAQVANLPTREEVEAHNAAHVPFRSWCPHCVKGKSKCGAHFKQREVEHEVPTISLDYFYFVKAEIETEREPPTLAMVDDKTGTLKAVTCKQKGVHAEAVEDVVKFLDSLGIQESNPSKSQWALHHSPKNGS